MKSTYLQSLLLAACLSPLGTHAQMSMDQAFQAGKSFAQSGKDAAKGAVSESAGQANLPHFNTNAPEGSYYGEGKSVIDGFGTSKIVNCRGYKAGNEYDQQECDAVNYLAKLRDERPQYDIDEDDPIIGGSDGIIKNPGPAPGSGTECKIVEDITPPTYIEHTCTRSRAIEERTCKKTALVSITMTNVLPDAPFRKVVANNKAPSWDITVNPKQGWADVTGYNIIIGQKDSTCNSGGDAGGSYPCKVPEFGTMTQRISIYGGQTPTQQGYKCRGDGFCGEWFVVWSQQINECTFRFNNYHVRGGAGYPDVHDYSQYNFCVPERKVSVTWQDDCGGLAAAAR